MNFEKNSPIKLLDVNDVYKIYIKANKIYSLLLWNTQEDEPSNRNAKNLLINHSVIADHMKTYFFEIRKGRPSNLDQLIINMHKILKWVQNVIVEYNNNHPNQFITNFKMHHPLTLLCEQLSDPSVSWFIDDPKWNKKLGSHINKTDLIVSLDSTEFSIINLAEIIQISLEQMIDLTKTIFEQLKIDNESWNQLTIKTCHYDYAAQLVIEQFSELKIRKSWFTKSTAQYQNKK